MPSVEPVYKIKLGDLAAVKNFKKSRDSLISEKVGGGLVRKLYATYLSYLSPEQFSYSIASYGDERGIFAEMLKTQDSGQFSFFTVRPGMTRVVITIILKVKSFSCQGEAKFRFRHVVSNEKYEIITSNKRVENY